MNEESVEAEGRKRIRPIDSSVKYRLLRDSHSREKKERNMEMYLNSQNDS